MYIIWGISASETCHNYFRCAFLLTEWYYSLIKVVQHIFKWNDSKFAPTEEELAPVLSRKYSFRVDDSRLVIEHAFEVDGDETSFGNETNADEMVMGKSKID